MHRSGFDLQKIYPHRLHDPGAARAAFELLHKEVVLAGQFKGTWEKVTLCRL